MMIYPMLAVDKNVEVSLREQAEWLKHGISTVRINTMQEAIEKLTKEPFLFTVINADNVTYLPLLKVMRNTAPAFIFIIETNYTREKEIAALRHGADVFTEFNSNVELNVQLALALMLRCNERDKSPTTQPGMIVYDNFLVLSNSRRIFYNDERLKLTKTEYSIMHYFIANHDIVLTYQQIYDNVWGEEFYENSYNALRNFILKLRKKIVRITDGRGYIETERETGYIFTAYTSK